ncbi:hypothetical protein [Fischerella sp. PCC 9605]|uniref:hypothetical protein n=1 Tax=Fischerella sp. PCC 9605 TaxID=1173024 RepID=UPI0018CC6A0D|nr:hypothetical protein [Fischerella sp. PCC 9605]
MQSLQHFFLVSVTQGRFLVPSGAWENHLRQKVTQFEWMLEVYQWCFSTKSILCFQHFDLHTVSFCNTTKSFDVPNVRTQQ